MLNILIFLLLGGIIQSLFIRYGYSPPRLVAQKKLKKIIILLGFSGILLYALKMHSNLTFQNILLEMARDEIFIKSETLSAVYDDLENKHDELRIALLEIDRLNSIYNNNNNQNDNIKDNNIKEDKDESIFGNILNLFGYNIGNMNNDNQLCPYQNEDDVMRVLMRHLKSSNYRSITNSRRFTPKKDLTRDQKKSLNRLSMLFHPDKLPYCKAEILNPAISFINSIRN